MIMNMTNNRIMIRINVHEAKARLSEYLARAEAGETVVICRRNVPVAELRAAPRPAESPRPFGLARGLFEVPDGFFDPLPEGVLRAFRGEGE
jgi:antitoxin (DNA-binding transcriptional repressor) of toxin-antitoxin stability system